MTAKVVLITGASSGLGRVCARHLADGGHIVYGTSRGRCEDSARYQMLSMDVTDPASIEAALDNIMEREGRLDVLVNNAGSGIAGSIEDTSIAELQFQFDVNCFGAMRVVQHVLPIMREQRRGHIITIGSIAGLIPVPFQGAYSASKSAVQSLTEALRMEVKPFGIRVTLVEPGDFRTGFTDNRVYTEMSLSNPLYLDRCKRAVGTMEEDERNGCDPILVAQLLEKIIALRAPKLRYTVGPIGQRLGVQLRKLVPMAVFERLITHMYK